MLPKRPRLKGLNRNELPPRRLPQKLLRLRDSRSYASLKKKRPPRLKPLVLRSYASRKSVSPPKKQPLRR